MEDFIDADTLRCALQYSLVSLSIKRGLLCGTDSACFHTALRHVRKRAPIPSQIPRACGKFQGVGAKRNLFGRAEGASFLAALVELLLATVLGVVLTMQTLSSVLQPMVDALVILTDGKGC